MNIEILGDWQTALAFTNGLKSLHAEWHSLFASGGEMRDLIKVLIAVSWVGAIWKFVARHEPKALLIIIAVPVYISLMALEVPAILPTPSMSSSISTSISQAQGRVSSAQTSLTQAQKSGAGVAAASKRLAAAQGDLAKLQSLQTASGKVVAKVPAAFALAYDFIGYPFAGIWDAINKVSYTNVTLQDRGTQAYLAAQLAASPQLTPAEKAVADQLSQCLQAKQDYVEQSAKISGYVKAGQDPNPTQNPPRTGKALADAWAALLAPTRTTMKTACHGMTTQLATALDKAITPQDVKDFEGGFQIGGHSWLQTSAADQEQYIASQMGVPVSQVAGKSPDEITKMFLRYKMLEAVSARLTHDLGKVGSSAAGAGFNASKSVSSKTSGWIADFLGSFGLAVKPAMLGFMNFLFLWLPVVFALAMVISLVPGQFKRAWSGIIIGMMFLFAWQITILAIEKSVASNNQEQVEMSAPKSGFGYVGSLVDGTFRNLTGGGETGDAVAATAVGAKAVFSDVGKKVISKVLMAGADTTIPGAVVAALATGAFATADAAKTISKQSAAFSKLMLSDGGLNPSLEALAGGQVEQQRAMVQAAQDRSQLIESILLIASPILAMVLAFGAWGAVGQAAGSQAVQQIGHSLGQTMLSGISKISAKAGRP